MKKMKAMSTSLRSSALLIALLSAFPLAVSAGRFEEQVARQLLMHGLVWTELGYELSHDVYINKLYRGQRYNLTLPLDANHHYVIGAVCDEDCLDIDLALYDDNGHLIDTDKFNDDVAIVEATPSWSARFTLYVTIPKCTARRCTFGVGVFSKP